MSDFYGPAGRGGTHYVCEALEPRRLLAAFVIQDFGNITNPATLKFADDELNTDFTVIETERFTFRLDRPAVVIASLSDLKKTNLFEEDLFGELSIVSLDAAGEAVATAASKTFFSGTSDLRVSLPAGSYAADLTDHDNLERFDLALHADTAPGLFSAGTFNPSALTARSLGTLSTAGTDVTEYVGLGPSEAVTDEADVYVFDVVRQGTVRVTLNAGVANDSFIEATLYRDFNGDRVFTRGGTEELDTTFLLNAGDTDVFSLTLPPARYGLAVAIPAEPGSFAGGNNYRLRTAYTVADGAGNSLAAARNAGTVGNGAVTFNDYLSPNDTTDVYKFTTVAGGPFVFSGSVSGVAPGSNFELDFIRDLDGDGVIDSNEVTTSDRAGNADEALSVPYTAPGTYFVRVRRAAGEGVYTLQFSNRNTDLGGNTLATAQNFGTLFGFAEFKDLVSATDTVDLYKFTLDRQSAFRATLTGLPANTNANLALIRDANGNGVVDAGETLASSANAGNAAETVTANLTAGTYFVRVSLVAGAPSYTLRLVKDAAGGTLATALTVSPGGGGNLDFLGPEDDADVYRFTLAASRLAGISVGLNNEPLLVRLGQDLNGDGVIGFQGPELLINKTLAAGAGELQRINLNAGTYFVLVNAVVQDEGTNYGVTVFNERPDLAGDTPAAARDLGRLSSARTFTDFVGDGSIDLMDDLDDFYRFTLGDNGPFDFSARLANLSANADLQLFRDDNLNNVADAGEVLATTTATGTAADTITQRLFTPGRYFLRVFRTSGQVDYTLALSATSVDTAGNTLATAAALGTLTTTITSANHFLGRIDRDDFFRFSVNGAGQLRAIVSGAPAQRRLELIRDVNNNLTIDAGETLAASASDLLNGAVFPAAGTYFLRVATDGSDGNYNLALAFSAQTPFNNAPVQISASGTSTIQIENYDNGGEGVAYHDATPGNDNGQTRTNESVELRTTADSGGGFRSATTAPTEFLEFTVNVLTSATYDFQFRVASPDPGATFHLAVDDVDVTGPLSIPDTNGFDTMTTVTRSNVPLAAGPHVLRLVHDTDTTAADNFAGNFNFIRVSPTPGQTGTFRFTPERQTVARKEQTTLALEWTVPVGGWRTLKTVDLRLVASGAGRGGKGDLIPLWVRFDEAANTLSLFDPKKHRFGPAKTIGGDGVLKNRYATIDLAATRIIADGASDPSVVLSLAVTFKPSAGGRTYALEAAATDDLGHADLFTPGGSLTVRRRHR